ncbi:pyrazinamidase/nicotinamidase [Phlegmacium glaucopus]|nr:pyrazinamidase/nicotinamidase [Phlegmacium glaucopus]
MSTNTNVTIAIDDTPIPSFVPALIVIDMQHDFVYGSLAVPGGETIISTINDIISLPGFKVKIATRDFHPDNHISFADTHQKPLFSTIPIFHPEDIERSKGIEQVLWPIHCVANTAGADFVANLKADSFDAIVHKGTHPHIESYSAFRDIWNKGKTELPELLSQKHVTDIFFVGLAGDYCVKYTAVDALEYGFKIWLVTDAIKSIAAEELTLEEMKRKGANFITSEDEKRGVWS